MGPLLALKLDGYDVLEFISPFWYHLQHATTSEELLLFLWDGLYEKDFDGSKFSQAVEWTVSSMPGMGSLPKDSDRYRAIRTTAITMLYVLQTSIIVLIL